MRKGAIAEWILRLVMPRERAAAAVGDLLEDSDGRDPSWFWTTLAWTVGSTVLRGVQAHPWRLTRSAVRGFFLLVYMSIFANMSTLLLGMQVGMVRIEDSQITALPAWFAVFLRILMALVTGRWTASREPGRELSAWLVMMLLWPPLAAITKARAPYYDFASAALLSLLGIVWGRWRTNRLERLHRPA